MEFSKWWINEFKTIKFPSQGTIFDYYLDPDTKKFLPWTDKVPSFELDPDVPLQVTNCPGAEMTHAVGRTCSRSRRGSAVGAPRKRGARRGPGGPSSEEGALETRPALRGSRPPLRPTQASLVHTTETIRIRYFMDLLMAKSWPVMLVGNAGTGKSVLMGDKLESLSTDDYLVQAVPFNFYTTSAMLQGGPGAPRAGGAGLQGGAEDRGGPSQSGRPHEPPRGCSLHPPPHTNPQGLATCQPPLHFHAHPCSAGGQPPPSLLPPPPLQGSSRSRWRRNQGGTMGRQAPRS